MSQAIFTKFWSNVPYEIPSTSIYFLKNTGSNVVRKNNNNDNNK